MKLSTYQARVAEGENITMRGLIVTCPVCERDSSLVFFRGYDDVEEGAACEECCDAAQEIEQERARERQV